MNLRKGGLAMFDATLRALHLHFLADIIEDFLSIHWLGACMNFAQADASLAKAFTLGVELKTCFEELSILSMLENCELGLSFP
jgi:hypothetical protein